MQKSTLYDPDDETTIVGYHYKKHSITSEGIEIKQRIEWTADVTCDKSYVAMLPAVRGQDAVSAVQVTDTFYDDKTLIEHECATVSLDAYLNSQNDKGEVLNLYGSASGVFLSVECKIKDRLSSAFAFLSNSEYYNKIYVGYNDDGYSVSSGDIWEWVSKYRITA